MKRLILAVPLTLFHFTFSLSAQAENLTDATAREIYKTIDDIVLAIHLYTPTDHQPTDQRPAAIFFFGGGWNGGTPAQFIPHARYLASRGMVAILADYRVASRHQTSPFECVKDAKSAVRWVRTHAKRLGIDPNRIAAGGGSAGGHLAAATATVEGLNEETDDLSVSAIPNALLLFNPVYDNGPDGYGHERVGDRYQEISPIHNIRQGMPPAIVFLGTNDKLIPVATAERFQAKMKEVGSRSELFLYEDQPHGFFNHPSVKPAVSPVFYYQTMLESDRFLASLGFLTGEATLQEPAFALKLNEISQQLQINYAGRPLAQYEFAYDGSTAERRHDTYKPFLHVMDANGKAPITKGPGGKFTHHRGIFLGFSRMKTAEEIRYDMWHMKQGVQVHRRFLKRKADAERATFTSEIAWQDNDGKVLVLEERAFTFSLPPAGAYAQIEMRSQLKPVKGKVTMSGDPEHAGAQFRPADHIVAKETQYTFHEGGIDPKKDLDLPWVGETFRLDSGKQPYSVVIFNHPANPKNTRFSAYRDYGRFGAYPEFEIAEGETATLRYQWLVSGGKMLPIEVIEATHDAFATGK